MVKAQNDIRITFYSYLIFNLITIALAWRMPVRKHMYTTQSSVNFRNVVKLLTKSWESFFTFLISYIMVRQISFFENFLRNFQDNFISFRELHFKFKFFYDHF